MPGNPRKRDLGRTEISAFLQRLDSDSTVADWQVSQAYGAIEVYYEQFRGIALAKPHTADAHVQGTSRPATEESISDTNSLSRQLDVGGSREQMPAPRVMEQPEAVPRPTHGHHHPQVDMSVLEAAVRAALCTESGEGLPALNSAVCRLPPWETPGEYEWSPNPLVPQLPGHK